MLYPGEEGTFNYDEDASRSAETRRLRKENAELREIIGILKTKLLISGQFSVGDLDGILFATTNYHVDDETIQKLQKYI